jgi:hypothetical protein
VCRTPLVSSTVTFACHKFESRGFELCYLRLIYVPLLCQSASANLKCASHLNVPQVLRAQAEGWRTQAEILPNGVVVLAITNFVSRGILWCPQPDSNNPRRQHPQKPTTLKGSQVRSWLWCVFVDWCTIGLQQKTRRVGACTPSKRRHMAQPSTSA